MNRETRHPSSSRPDNFSESRRKILGEYVHDPRAFRYQARLVRWIAPLRDEQDDKKARTGEKHRAEAARHGAEWPGRDAESGYGRSTAQQQRFGSRQ